MSESEVRFRALADAVPVLLWMSGPDKQAIYFNQTWLQFTGKPEDEQLGAGWLELVHPDDRTRLNDICLQAFRGRRPFTAEFRLRRADGAYRWLLDNGTPRFDLAGAFAGFTGSCVDITDRKEGEEARALLAAVVESSNDAIVSKTLDGIIRSWNSGAERIFGYAAEEAVGLPITVIIPPELQDEERSILARLRRGERIDHYETVRVSKHGRRIEISLTVSPVRDRDGRIVGASKIARDITDRKRTEKALHSSEERFRSMANVTPAMIWTASPDGTITWSSDRWFEYTGIPRAENPSDWPRVLHPDDVERCLQAWTRALAEGTDYEIEVRNRRHDGEYRWFLTRATPIRDADGSIVEWYGSTTDIHDRKKADEALRESEERFRAVVESQSEMLCRFRVDGTILFVNGAYARARGTTQEALVGADFWGFIDREDHPGVRAMLDRLRPDSPEIRIENRFETTQGTRWTLWSNRGLVFGADGRVTEVQSSGIDITDRKQAEEALRRHSEEVRTLLETLPIGVFFAHDPLCRRMTANRAGYALLRMSMDENISKTAEAIERPTHFRTYREGVEVPPERLPVQRAARGESVRDEEIDHVFDDGTVLNLLISAAPLHDEGERVRGAVASVLDVTERKRMEQSLRFLAAASKSLSALVDYKSTLQKVATLAVPCFADWCAVDMLDAQGSLSRLAAAPAEPSGVEPAEESHPGDFTARAVVPYATETLKTGRPKLVNKPDDPMASEAVDGRDRPGLPREPNLKSCMCVPLTVKGRTLGVMTFVSAGSGRRYRVGDLAMAEDLARRAAVAIENAELYQELREADRRKDEFLAMLAHELRNPLAPIRSGLDILAMDEDSNRETIELMQEQVRHLLRLVDDLLDVSRIMRGRIELRREPAELTVLIDRSVEAVRALSGGHGPELVVAVPEQPIWLDADPVRLVQVIENLLNNAFKYTDAKGRVELTAESREGQAVISLRDTGIGIEPELLPNVFDLFTQSSRSLDRSQGGLGIGLTLVRKLVELHDGSVSAYSKGPGHGSTFTLRLPLADVSRQPGENARPPCPAQRRRILVVDDNDGAATMLSLLLGRLGDHEIEIAHDGRCALAKARELHPDIILLDIGLPDMDGYEVARVLRETDEFDGVLLVALTGYGQEEDRRRSKEAGFDRHLVKPAETSELERLLAEPRPSRR